jgi:hypothetical protein
MAAWWERGVLDGQLSVEREGAKALTHARALLMRTARSGSFLHYRYFHCCCLYEQPHLVVD